MPKVVKFDQARRKPRSLYVKAYCQYVMMFPITAKALLKQARKDGAPETACFKDPINGWVCVHQLDYEAQGCIEDLVSLMKELE